MADKITIARRLAGLPPEKRALLRKLLASKAKNIHRRDPQARVPLTFSQQRLWLMDQIVPGNPAYNEANFIRIHSVLNVDCFRRAVNEIIRRHEALRTVIAEVDGEPTQQVRPALTLEIPLSDLRQLAPEVRESEALRLAAAQAQIPFKLETGPLIRASLYRLEANDFLFEVTMHHIICDSWSFGVFAGELSALYWSFVARAASPLPELEIQYPDYAVWQRRSFDGEAMRAQLDYWRVQLADLPQLELPTNHPRPAEFSFRGARRPVQISGELFQSLLALCKREGVTLHILILAALFVVLHRYSGQDDIAVGCPIAGRGRKELEPLIGFLVNTLVLRVNLSGDPRFLDLLADVRRTSFKAYESQDVPFEFLIEELHPVRDKSRNPLVQVVYQMFQPPGTGGANTELVFPLMPLEFGVAKFDLALHLLSSQNEIRGHVEYSTDLFDGPHVERMISHFDRLLERIAADPTRRISQLPILSEDEERGLLVELNATEAAYPRDSSIPEIFAEQALSTPDHVAVRFGGDSLSYRELDERSGRAARALLGLGVKPWDAVGLLVERGLDLPVVMLGIAKCGALCVPLDPSNPAERLSYLVADSGAKVLVSDAKFQGAASALGAETILVEEALSDAGRAAEPAAAVEATDAACLLYTSGTTGKPKGVALTHRSILRLVRGMRYVRIGGDDVILQFAATTFDASAFEIWGALLNGATLAIYPPGTPSLDELGAFIKESGVTLLFLTTSLFRQMAERNADDLRFVRQLLMGGEAMAAEVAREAWKALPRTRLIHAYGPTECTTFATTYAITNPESIGDGLPIGSPIENTRAYILDDYGMPVPVGVPGEIYLGGDGVARGYWNRPALTAERFVPDPFGGEPGGRMYRTGDIGKYREDGEILFLGRRDRQVKLSGYRIELAEVEAAVTSHPDVSGAAVLMTQGDDKRLTAYVECLPGHGLTFAGLRQYLSGLLPHYMIPTHLEVLDALPLTSSKKVDYQALSRLGPSAVVGQAQHVPPRSPVEKVLADIWQETLGAERVGVSDNFFDLGGQSLIATRVLSRVREKLRAEVTMRQFFDAPTIAGLAAIVARDGAQAHSYGGSSE
jgi:amino acid adenylation domain-containing protein